MFCPAQTCGGERGLRGGGEESVFYDVLTGGAREVGGGGEDRTYGTHGTYRAYNNREGGPRLKWRGYALGGDAMAPMAVWVRNGVDGAEGQPTSQGHAEDSAATLGGGGVA